MKSKELDFESISAGEIGELLDIPLSTLRFYISGYSRFLNSSAIRGRNRRFNIEDLIILAKINSLWKQHSADKEIHIQIENFKAMTIDDKVSEGVSLLSQLQSELQAKFDSQQNSLNKQISKLKRILEGQ
jgi:DNA-binding transcriptional MerR regulator